MKKRNWLLGASAPPFLLLASADSGEGGGEGGAGAAGGEGGGEGSAGEGGAGGGGEGGGAGEPWYGKDLDREGQVYIEKNGFKGYGDVLKTAMHQEKLLGVPAAQLLKLPTDRTPQNMVEVLRSIGAPKDAAGYDIKEDATRGIDGPLVGKFSEVAAAIGLLPFQKDALLAMVGDNFVELQTANTASEEAKLADGEKAIKELFGDAFDDKVRAIDDFIAEHGGEEMQDYLFKSNRGNDPVFAKFMDKMVKLCSERGALPGEKGRDTRTTGKLSPAEAEAQLRDFEKNNQAALADRTHPDHKALVDKRLELIEMANPAPQDS